MSYVSKTWVDRQSEFPTRRKLIHTDLSEEQVTVMRDEGTVTTQGDVFDANTMNNLESRISAGLAEKQDVLTAGTGITIDSNNVISATGGGGGSSTLADLTDTNISNPQNGQALVYDSSSNKWVNANGGGGGDVELSKTVSGSICSFSDGADGLPVKDLVAQVVAVQSGTGDPSPSNVRLISGWSAVNVMKTRKNIISFPYYSSDGGYSGVTVSTQSDGKITATGTAVGTFTFYLNRYITLYAGTYALSVRGNHTGARLYVRDFGNAVTIATTEIGTSDSTVTFTINKKLDNIGIYFNCSTGTAVTVSAYVQLELGSTATSYEPYNGTTTNVSLGQTVYGGSRNITSGELAITHGSALFNGSESWSKNGETDDYINLVSTVSDLVSVANSDTVVRIKADKFNGVSANTALGAGTKSAYQIAAISNSRVYVVMPKTVVESAVAFKTWLESNNVQIVYELATPVTVQQTGVEITAHETTNIWTDSGDTTVTYYTSSAEDVIDLVQYDTTKQDKLTAGTGITIDSSNVISATGGGGGAVIDDTTTSTTSVWSSSKTNGEIEAKKAQILVPEYNEIHNYFAGEICIHEGVMYKASVATQGTWDSSKWVALSMMHYINEKVGDVIPNAEIGELLDVDVATAQDGQVLKYNSTSGAWENANESGGAQALNDLTDVSVSSPTNGQVLIYYAPTGTGRWVAGSMPTPWVELTATIPARQPSDPAGTTVNVLISDSSITTTKTYDIYVDTDGVYPLSKTVSQGVIDLEFEPQSTAVGLKVRVS